MARHHTGGMGAHMNGVTSLLRAPHTSSSPTATKSSLLISSTASSLSVSTTTTSVTPTPVICKLEHVVHHPYYITGPYRMYQCSPLPLIIASIGYIFTLILMGVSNAVANMRRPLNVEPLRDLSFEYLPHFHTNGIANNLVYGSITSTAWILILHPRRRHLCRRLLTMWAIIYLMRATTISVTSLPDPNDMCRTGVLENGVDTFLSGLSCGDMIFSGHTVALILNPLILGQAFPHMPNYLFVFIWVYACLGMWALLATHMHYLVDILVAIYISGAVYWGYHASVTNDKWLARYEWLAWWEYDRYYSCTLQQMVTWVTWRLRGEPGSIDPRVGEDPSFDYLVPSHAIHHPVASSHDHDKSSPPSTNESVVTTTTTTATLTTASVGIVGVMTPSLSGKSMKLSSVTTKQSQQYTDDDISPSPPAASNIHDDIDDNDHGHHHTSNGSNGISNGSTDGNGISLRAAAQKSR